MPTPAIDIVKDLLAHMGDEARIRQLVAPDATYVSLAFENADLKKIMPWAGSYPSQGPSAFISTFTLVAQRWKVSDFGIDAAFGEGDNVAVFGHMQ